MRILDIYKNMSSAVCTTNCSSYCKTV